VFASCDGDGFIEVWDLNKDTESPIARKKTGNKSVSHLRWSMDGRKIVIGDSEGIVSMW
jgi:WD40 repeat protein